MLAIDLRIVNRKLRWLVAVSIAMGATAILWAGVQRSVVGAPAAAAGAAYIYRFDSLTHTFFTITLPADSLPTDLVVTGSNPLHAWFTDFGRHSLGHLIFTGTLDYVLAEVPITSTVNSGPYRLTINGQHVWFTERGANRVGRLDTTTGAVDEFYGNGLSPDSGLSDIKVAPNGWVWVGAPWARQLVRLIVTAPQNYAFTVYTDTVRLNHIVAPAALAIENNNSIWFAAPDAPAQLIGQYTPSLDLFDWASGLPAGSTAQDLVIVDGSAWVSNRTLNALGQIELATLSIYNGWGPIEQPVSLAAGVADTFWVTQHTARGALGRVVIVHSEPPTATVSSFPLPTSGLVSFGLAVSGTQVWLAAYRPARLYLPITRK